MTKKLKGKIALITGASRGIGRAAAIAYAKQGAHVVLIARTVGALEEVDDQIKSSGGNATLVPLDLTEFAKIDELGLVIAQKFGRLDVLLGNAAILGTLSPVGHITPDIWQKVFDINVTANYRLIRSFDSLLRQSKAARVIFLTSGITKANISYWGAYAASKAALEKISNIYANELKDTNIKVNLIDPGVVKTKMRKAAMPGEDETKLVEPCDIIDKFVELASSDFDKTGQVFYAQK